MRHLNIILLTLVVALLLATGEAFDAQTAGAGSALDFDGSNDYVDCGNDHSLDITTNRITLEAWVKYPHQTDNGVIVSKHCNACYPAGYRLVHSEPTRKIYFDIFDGNIHSTISATAIDDDNWHHVAGTWDGSTMTLYIDGDVNGTPTSYSGTPGNDNIHVNIGAEDSGYECFKGTIDEVRIWNVAPDQSTIRDWMCKKVNSNHPSWNSLKGYWRFDEGSGATAYDQTSNNNSGTLNFSSGWVISTAPLGDASVYTTTCSGTLNLASNDGDDITLENIGGSPSYVALIRVDEGPNYTGVSGLHHVSPLHYWEVWMTGGTSPDYDIVYNYEGHPGCEDENDLRLGKRADATVTTWTDADATLDTDANMLTLTNQSGTQWILACETSDCSLPVELSSFTLQQPVMAK